MRCGAKLLCSSERAPGYIGAAVRFLSIWIRSRFCVMNSRCKSALAWSVSVSLPAAVISFRWLTRSKFPPQVCAPLFQASTEIRDLLRVHKFLVSRRLILGRKLDSHSIDLFTLFRGISQTAPSSVLSPAIALIIPEPVTPGSRYRKPAPTSLCQAGQGSSGVDGSPVRA